MRKMARQSGFTLVELMIVTVIVAILAAIAYPSYQNQVSAGRRADAQSALMGLAQAMERQFTEEGTYAKADGDDSDESAVSVAPTIFPSQAPIDGSQKFYNLRIINASATAYTLQAIPIAGGGQAGDGILQLTSVGAKSWDRSNDGSFSSGEECWAKSC